MARPLDSDIDLEDQQIPMPRPEVGGSEVYGLGMAIFHPDTSSVKNPVSPVSQATATGQDSNSGALPTASQAEVERRGESDTRATERITDQSQRNNVNVNATSDRRTQAGQGQIQAEIQFPEPMANDLNVDPPPHTNSDPEPQEPHMIGDFNDSANDLWILFGTGIKSLDDAQIKIVKDKMDSALIFAGLYSAVLTGFLIDSKGRLKADPTDRIEYYLQQHSTILSQISRQLASITPQASIPSTPPLPFPTFRPSASNIRVNVFWFLGLISSLLAAFLAIVIQKWVRSNTEVFQRDSDPLKSARLRQYLREGFEQWHLPRVAEAVPGLLLLSLFLFFIGLGDSLLNINTTVGLTTIAPIGYSGLLYIFTIFAPIIYPQSPFQNSFSGFVWRWIHKFPWRQYWDLGWKPVSIIMEQGQMQLAMEETDDRSARDGLAIQWLIGNQTEDAEIEKLLMAIPGSFDSEWGIEVWRKISHTIEPGMPPIVRPPHLSPTNAISYPPARYPPTIYPPPATVTEGERIIRNLVLRFARYLRTFKLENRSPSTGDDLWRRRTCTRAFIETTATLFFFVDSRFTWIEDIVDLLGDIGSFEKMRELSWAGTDQKFVTRWTCLSLLAIRRILDSDQKMWNFADEALHLLTKDGDTGEDNEALTGAQTFDKNFRIARRCLYELSYALSSWQTENLTEVEEILESVILELERISIDAGQLENVDRWIFETQSAIAPQITSHFPGILDDLDTTQVSFSHFVEMFRDPRQIQFIRPGQTLKNMCSIFPTLRNVLEGRQDADAYKQMLKNLMEFRSRASNWHGDELQRQLWRLQDLRNGRGFGYTVELFLLGLKQLLSKPKESHYALYMGTFRAITYDWEMHKYSIGTQKLLLDIALSRSVDFQSIYPRFIADAFLELLGNIFEGQKGSHIDDAVRQLSASYYFYDAFRARVLDVITRVQAKS